MKKLLLIILFALSIQSGMGQNKVIMHHSYWSPDKLPVNGTFNWTGITHLVIFGPEPDLANSGDHYMKMRRDVYSDAYGIALTAEAHANNVKVVLCVGGIDRGFEWQTLMAGSSTFRTTVVNDIVNYAINTLGADGVDVDWESSVSNWIGLGQAFRTALDAIRPGLLLYSDIGREPFPVGSTGWNGVNINLPIYDHVQVMLYDANGWWSDKSGFHNSLDNSRLDYPSIDVESGRKNAKTLMGYFVAQGATKSKMSLGLCLYPRVFHDNSPAIYAPGQTSYSPTQNPYPPNEGLGAFNESVYPKLLAGAVPTHATNSGMAWIGSQSGNYYMDWIDAQGFADFISYTTTQGFGGIMIFAQEHQYFSTAVNWPIGSGTYTKTPLLDDIRAALTPTAPAITTQPSNTSIFVGGTAIFTVSASGTSPAYQWQKNGTNISSAVNASYTTPTAVIGDNGSTFRCIVSNSIGTVTSNNATLTVTNASPSITTQPTSKTVSVGQTATFTVVATGTQPLTYQWQKGTVSISGATSASYTTPAAQSSDNGSSFRCIVSNSIGTSTSNSATMTVLASVPFAGDDFSSGSLNTSLWTYTNPSPTSTMSFSGVGTHDALLTIAVPSGSEHDLNSSGINSPRVTQDISNVDNFGLELKGQSLQPTVNYTFWGILVANSSGDFIRAGMAFDTYGVHPYVQTKVGATVTRRDANGSPITNATRYWIRLTKSTGDVWDAYYSTDSLSYTSMASFTQVFTVEQAGFTVANATGGSSPAITQAIDYMSNMASPLTNEDPTVGTPPVITVQPTDQSANPGATATFTQNITGSPAPTYQWQKNQVNIGGATSQNYTTPAVVYATDNGAAFRCVVSNTYGTVISNEAILTVNVAPIITIQPASVTIDSNQAALFSVTHNTAVPTASYQWQKNTVNISGATTQTYQVVALPADSGATFRCIVSNTAGTVTSTSAILNVNRIAPDILTNPTNLSVVVGQTATFTVTAKGKSPYFLQWQKNGTDISGATSLSYTTAATVLGDNGNTYRCRAFSGYGSDTSGSATLTVTAVPPPPTAPTISTQPTAQSVVVGQTATFTIGATGTAPLAYQWQLNTVNIGSATSSSYTTPATVIGDDGGSFRCIVSNGTGTATSAAAILSVSALPDTTNPTIEVVFPDSGQEFTAGTAQLVTVNLLDIQLATAILLPGGQVLGTYPYSPGTIATPNAAPIGGIQVSIPYIVPFDSGYHRIAVYFGTISDTSDTFHISYPDAPSIIITTDPTELTLGTREYALFTFTTNNADSTKVLYRRDTDEDFMSVAYNRNIKVIPLFSDYIVGMYKAGYIKAYPLSRTLYIRVYAWKNGLEAYVEKVIEIG